MTHADPSLRQSPQPRSRRIFRVMLLAMMALCGVMMAALLLSDPMITSKVKSAVETVTARFGGLPSESVFDDEPQAISSLGALEIMVTMPPKARPQVSTDAVALDDPAIKVPVTIRVRRAGVLAQE